MLHTSLVMWLIWRAVVSLKFQACLTYPSIHPLRSHLSWSWQLAFSNRVDGWMSTSHLFHRATSPSNSVWDARLRCNVEPCSRAPLWDDVRCFIFLGIYSLLLLLPRLSHQAPTNLTCFSHFLHRRERERDGAQRRGGGAAARGMCTGS